MSDPVQIVWFKRDLRLQDHPALSAAAARGPVIGLVVYEPSLWSQPDASGRHAAFQTDCLREFQGDAARHGLTLLVVQGEMPTVLSSLRAALGACVLHSHEETGNWASFERDRRIKRWCREHQIDWCELPQNGVVRALKSRDDWSRIHDIRMSASVLPVPRLTPLSERLCQRVLALQSVLGPTGIRPWDDFARTDACPGRQTGGRRQGLALMDSFLAGRGASYRSHMSSPGTAEQACSRLSTHLAWGSLSVREVLHAVWQARARWQGDLRHPEQRAMLASLKSFESRLHWRCHFMQKLESEPEIEFRCLHPATRGLRNEPELDREEKIRLDAWSAGQTGLPFVDACMRYLRHTGWINFRMRAMLASFASQHLWLHWKFAGDHLARLYTDYEPGIHWPQMQMQSGTTGINTIRIYNPEKQRHDQDPTGSFVAAWVPEYGSPAYPDPIVDHLAAARTARERLWSLRKQPGSREIASEILDRHGSRNPAREGVPARRPGRRDSSQAPRPATVQGELDF